MNGPNTRFWDVIKDDIVIGKVTSAVYSPRLKQNIGLALIDIRYSDIGEKLKVDNGLDLFDSMVVEKPFYDPNKNLTKS
jgi:aminomethyltransferase